MQEEKLIAVDRQDDKGVVFTTEAVYVFGESSTDVEFYGTDESPFERVPCKK